MNNSPLARTAAVAAVALALFPAAAEAARKTETLRFFSKETAAKFTQADGTVIDGLPEGEPQAGDLFELWAVDYAGDHKRHSKRPIGSDHTRCEFQESGEPECRTYAAFGGSMLIAEGFPGTIVGGTGRYYGATGRVVKNKEVKGGSDIVVRVHLRGRARSSTAAERAWERALRLRGEALNELSASPSARCRTCRAPGSRSGRARP